MVLKSAFSKSYFASMGSGAGVFRLPGSEEAHRIDLASGSRVGENGVKIGWTVKTEIVDFQMMNLKIFGLFSGLSAENQQESVVGVNVVNDQGIFFGKILIGFFENGRGSRLMRRSVNLQADQADTGNMHLRAQEFAQAGIDDYFFRLNRAEVCRFGRYGAAPGLRWSPACAEIARRESRQSERRF